MSLARKQERMRRETWEQVTKRVSGIIEFAWEKPAPDNWRWVVRRMMANPRELALYMALQRIRAMNGVGNDMPPRHPLSTSARLEAKEHEIPRRRPRLAGKPRRSTNEQKEAG